MIILPFNIILKTIINFLMTAYYVDFVKLGKMKTVWSQIC